MNRMRDVRRSLRLSQADVASAAGLSRQLVGAVEAGRHAPSVNAALAIAAVLETTVEDLFTPSGGARAEPVGDLPEDGAPIVVTTVGDRLCYGGLPHRGAGAGAWLAADGTYEDGAVCLFPGTQAAGAMVSGCDPALGLAAALLPARGPRRVAALQASSRRAASDLRAGRLHAALVHGRRATLVPPATVQRCSVAAWEVGLATRPDAAVDLERLAAGGLVVARREAGAAAQQALERVLEEAVGPGRELHGPLAAGHLDAALHVVHGSADVAVTFRAAALAYGLGFTPLEHHAVELWIGPQGVGHPGIEALGDVLASRAFRARLESVGGYELPP
jgi:DNA-binding XRE family transcriptional regulator